MIGTSVAASGHVSFTDCQFASQYLVMKGCGTSHLNLPAFLTTNLLYGSHNKLSEVVVRYSIPLLQCKSCHQQSIFDQVAI